jgi:hypothetical protein
MNEYKEKEKESWSTGLILSSEAEKKWTKNK